MEAGWGRRLPQNASRRRRRKSGSANPTPSRSPGTDEAGAGRRLRAKAGPAASLRPRDDVGKEPEGSRGGRQWLTWEVIMMLESIRKLMVKCRESSRLHFPLPETTARPGRRPPHIGGLRPGAATQTSARLADAIKLRPSHPISSHIQCFPPPARSGRDAKRRGGESPGAGPGRDAIVGAGLN